MRMGTMIALLSCLPGCHESLVVSQLDLYSTVGVLSCNSYLGKGTSGAGVVYLKRRTRPEKARTEELQLRLQRRL